MNISSLGNRYGFLLQKPVIASKTVLTFGHSFWVYLHSFLPLEHIHLFGTLAHAAHAYTLCHKRKENRTE